MEHTGQGGAVRRRRRPAVSCITCRKRKIRCDRKAPCGNCLKSKGSSCSYRDPPLSPPKATTPRCATSLPNDCVDDENDELDVASCFSITTPPMPPSLVNTTNLGIAGTFHIHHESRQGQPNVGTFSIAHKTRYFGQSHWVNSITLVRDLFAILEPHFRNNSSPHRRVHAGMQRSGKDIEVSSALLLAV